jgi:general secretion pathway protein C
VGSSDAFGGGAVLVVSGGGAEVSFAGFLAGAEAHEQRKRTAIMAVAAERIIDLTSSGGRWGLSRQTLCHAQTGLGVAGAGSKTVETILRKYMWGVDAVVATACAIFLGLSASSMVEARYVGVLVPKAASATARTEQPKHDKRPDGILRRNIFCSACPPIRLDGDPEPEPAADKGPADPQLTSLPLRLVAVMYSPTVREMKWSTAIIRNDDEKTIGAYRTGGEVHGATLVSILDTRVYLDNAGTTEFLDLLPPAKPAQAAPGKPAPTPPHPTDPLAVALERGIKKVGDRRYELQRSTLESVLGNMSLLARAARIVPDVRAGKPYGFRLFAVRPDGPFAKIGLQNGDVVVSINGLEMNSPEKALEVYGKLKSASHLALGLERMGKKVEQEYNIR